MTEQELLPSGARFAAWRKSLRVYARALDYFRTDRQWLLLLLSLTAISTGLSLMAAWPMAVLVDCALSDQPRGDWMHRLFLSVLPDSRVGQIAGLAVLGLAVKVGQDLIGAMRHVVTCHVHYRGLLRVRSDVFTKLQQLSMDYHRNQSQGGTIYRLSSDALGCQGVLDTILGGVVAVATLTVMTVILCSRHAALTVLALSIAPALAWANVCFGKRFHDRSVICKETDAAWTTTVQRSIATISLVQLFGRQQDELSRFENAGDRTVSAWWGFNRQHLAYTLLTGLIFGFGHAIVFGVGGYLVHRDHFVLGRTDGMTVGDLLIFSGYLGMLWGPLCALTGLPANLQGAKVSVERVFEVLDEPARVRDLPGAHGLPMQARTLSLECVSFRYGDGPAVLRGLSAVIEPGALVAFVGPSGAGKTTLLHLLPRIADPTGGAIRLDGHDLREVKLADLRRHIALLPQDCMMLPVSVAENIAYGRPGATQAQIEHAAYLAGASEFIAELPEGYDTVLTEGGTNLSGGQRQRIAIARALLTEAPILVLDEPTNALDAQHEQWVTRTLERLRGQRTVIVVTHRLSSVSRCDCIHVLENGCLREQGAPAQLMRAGGLYQRMLRLQMPDDVQEPDALEPVA